MNSTQLIAAVQRSFAEHGRLHQPAWKVILQGLASVARPAGDEVFVATTFDVIDGELRVRQEPAFLYASPGPVEPKRCT